MLGVEGPDRELWDAAEVVGHLVAAGGMFAFLAAHRAQVFPDEQYADLFSPVGRPSIPATRMAAVLTLQALHELSDRVISTVDPQARHTRKSPRSRRDGYRAHLVAEPGTGLITDEALTMAAGPDNADPALAQQFLAPAEQAPAEQAPTEQAPAEQAPAEQAPTEQAPAEQAPSEQGGAPCGDAGLAPAPADPGESTAAAVGSDAVGGSEVSGSEEQDQGLTWYGDSAYGTGELRNAISRAGDRAVIKPKPLAPAVAGGFTLDDFTVDEPVGTLTCPAGPTRSLSPGRTVTFGALCRDCPLRAGCTTAKTGRAITLHKDDQRLRAAHGGATWSRYAPGDQIRTGDS